MNSADLEKEHVHQVYNEIAQHFSQTRYKPWPVIHSFLQSLPIGSFVGDFGCGNGKYTATRPSEIFYFCTDMCLPLLSIAKELNPKPEFHQANLISSPFKQGILDASICIAALHHLSSRQRRLKAIQQLIQSTKQQGPILIYCWALEQSESSKRDFSHSGQDVFVPWVRKNTDKEEKFERFYHLYKQGELEEEIKEAAVELEVNITVTQSGYDRDNWFCIFYVD